jgi:hypothetical protein
MTDGLATSAYQVSPFRIGSAIVAVEVTSVVHTVCWPGASEAPR